MLNSLESPDRGPETLAMFYRTLTKFLYSDALPSELQPAFHAMHWARTEMTELTSQGGSLFTSMTVHHNLVAGGRGSSPMLLSPMPVSIWPTTASLRLSCVQFRGLGLFLKLSEPSFCRSRFREVEGFRGLGLPHPSASRTTTENA